MPEQKVEFVNRKAAESEASRAVGLLRASDESKVEAWFALQVVADLIGPESNTGRKGIHWTPSTKPSYVYKLRATCLNGNVDTSTGAPKTKAEALDPKRLDRVEKMLLKLADEKGGLIRTKRPKGTSDALIEAISASPEGRGWLSRTKTADKRLLQMVRVADGYGRDGINPEASLSAHVAFLTFENRSELVQACQTGNQARAKAMSLGLHSYQSDPASKHQVSNSRVTRLAIRAGVTRLEARVILRALMDGRSKAKLIRAINEAEKVLTAPVPIGRPRKEDMARAA